MKPMGIKAVARWLSDNAPEVLLGAEQWYAWPTQTGPGPANCIHTRLCPAKHFDLEWLDPKREHKAEHVTEVPAERDVCQLCAVKVIQKHMAPIRRLTGVPHLLPAASQ